MKQYELSWSPFHVEKKKKLTNKLLPEYDTIVFKSSIRHCQDDKSRDCYTVNSTTKINISTYVIRNFTYKYLLLRGSCLVGPTTPPESNLLDSCVLPR